ncbi:MAG: hypothetical protein RIM84_06535 [Alphaproteobacteria bacterium]
MTAATSIAFAPLLPWPWLAGLALLALAALGFGVWRRAPGMAWRLLGLGIAVLALANPSLVREQRRPLNDIAVVVIDESPSQRFGDRQQATADALAEVEQRLAQLPNLEVRVVSGGRPKAGSDGTRLIEALGEGLSDVPRERVAGAILITDGQVHDLPEDPTRADPGGPVHVLLTGARGERDRRLVIEKAPRYGIVGEPQTLTVRVVEQGGQESGNATVTLSQDGERQLERPARIGGTVELPFTLTHGGQSVIEIEVGPGDDELTLTNNRTVLLVNGVRDRLRVLLVSGEPHSGERTWRNILKSDPAVDLVHFTILRPPEKQDGTPIGELSLISFPTRELFQAKLNDFDLVIFDRYRRRGVLPDLYLFNVAEYVRGGGAVLTAAGPAFATPLSLYRTPLAQVLPARPTGVVVTEGFRAGLSPVGVRHPVTANLPGSAAPGEQPTWGRWFRMVEATRDRGEVVMVGPGERPMLVLDRVGEGRVAQMLSDHGWLWARGFEGGGPQAELLRRAAHWLMKEPELEEEDLRAVADGNQLRISRRSLEAGDREITVTTPAGDQQTVTLADDGRGVASAAIAVDQAGLYRLRDGQRTAVAAVGNLNPLEYADLRASPAPLAPLTELTGGGAYWLQDGLPSLRRVQRERDRTGSGWLGLVENREYLITGVAQYPLLPAVLALLLVLGGMMLAWRREGR